MSKRTVILAAAVMALSVASAQQQVVSPPTPGGFRTRNMGSSAGVNVEMPQPQPQINSAAGINQLTYRIQALMRARRYDEAEAAVMELIKRDTTGQYAPMYLRQIQAGRSALEAPLQQLIVPTVEFRQASLPDVVKFLSDVSTGLTPDKRPLSFVLQVPSNYNAPPVSLNLRNVPMLDVLRYVTSSAGLVFRIEPHAIIITRPVQAAPVAETLANP